MSARLAAVRSQVSQLTDGRRARLLHLVVWPPFLVLAARHYGSTPDDAFITMRYAANVLDGYGPVFNEGQRVEGFSSLGHLLVDVVCLAIPGGYDVLKVKLASLLFGVLALDRAVRLLDVATDAPLARVVGRLPLATSPIAVANAFSGLDTTMAMWAVSGLVLAAVEERGTDEMARRGRWAIAAILIRPEAFGIVAIVAACSFAPSALGGGDRSRRWLAVPAAGLVALVGLRLAYYGSVVPNTAIAKHVPLDRAIGDGLEYLRASLWPLERSIGPLDGRWMSGSVVAVWTIAALVGTVDIVRRRPALVRVVAVVLGQAAFVLYAGGDWMGSGRFVAPVVHLLVIVQVVGAVAVARGARSPAVGRLALAGLLVAGALATRTSLGANGWPAPERLTDRALIELEGDVWAATPDLLGCAPAGWTVAYSEMGYGPWVRRDLRFIDLRGLVDADIARAGDDNDRSVWGADDPRWGSAPSPTARIVLDRDPEVIVLSDVPPESGPDPSRYREVDRRPVGDQVLHVYVRRDVAARCD